MNYSPNHYQYIPEAFLNKMADLLGDEFENFRSSLQQAPSMGIRVNTLKISPQDFAQITTYKISLIPWCSAGYTLNEIYCEPGTITPGKHIHHISGLYYVQEPSAMAAGEALSPKPGEKILDLAAAPGGKSTHLATLMRNTGLLVANEIHPKRVWDLAENLERCGVTNAVVLNESPQRLSAHFGEYFDRVMLDAPCSGEGMFRKSENARKQWEQGSPRSCSIRQFAILEQAAQMVKPGGCIAYTTCTFSPEENEGVIARFLENHPEFEIQTCEKLPGVQPSRPEWIGLPKDHKIKQTMRIWPHQSPGEGHFIALLTKVISRKYYSKQDRRTDKISLKSINKSRETRIAILNLEEFARVNLDITFDPNRIFLEGSYVYQSPEIIPNLDGLKVIHSGWWIGSIHKERFTPSHSFAMGITASQAKQTISLQSGAQEVSTYLGGGIISNVGENGWVLVTVGGYPIGWGKRIQNVTKNYYPHGLRHQP